MPTFPGFIGPAFAARSAAADSERCVNLYPEQNGPNAASPWILYSTPGLATFATLPTTPIRGTWVGEGRLFAVAGSRFYEVFSNGTYTDRGDVGSGTSPAQIFPNGNQVMIVAGGNVYIDTGTAIIQPTFTSAQGSVSSDGAGNLTLIFGDYFDESMVGSYILLSTTLGGTPVPYQITGYTDNAHITVDSSMTVEGDFFYTIAVNGLVSTSDNSGHGFVVWLGGDKFDYSLVGHVITINGADYHVRDILNPTVLITEELTGAQDAVPYIASVPVTASSGCFLDGYFIVAIPNSKQFNISGLYNGLRWDPMDNAWKEGYPDNIQMLIADHEELYLMGTETAEVWRNSGNPDFPFERDSGAFMHLGTAARWSVVRCTESQSIKWVGGDAEGQPVVYSAKGYAPVRISTHALEYRWSQFTTWADAEAYVYVEDGHEFYVINFPTAGETWVYDALAGVWHQRAAGTNPNSLTRHRGRCYAFVFGKHILGDYSTGVLYRMSSELTDDAGSGIVRVRRAPHLTDDLKRSFYSQFILALAGGTYSSLTLTWSDDYGTTWVTPRNPDGPRIASGTPGRTIAQRWNRLGSARDRMFEVSMVASSKVAWISAEIEATPGN
jgi:hypothetical protein